MPRPIRDIFVSPSGSDDADGFKHPLASLQAAFDLAYGFIGDARIRIADGEYPGTNATARGCRQGTIEIIGNIESPERVRFDSGEEYPSISTIWAVEGAILSVKGLHVSATTNTDKVLGCALRATYNGIILLTGPMVFGPATYCQMVAGNGRIIPNHGYTVEGGSRYHILSSTGSSIATTPEADQRVILKRFPHYSGAFAACQTGSVINWRLPFVGKATGCTHIINSGGTIETKAIGSNADNTPDDFPGDEPPQNICGFFNGKVYGVYDHAPGAVPPNQPPS